MFSLLLIVLSGKKIFFPCCYFIDYFTENNFNSFSPTRVSQLTVVLGVVDLQDSNKILRRIKTVVRHKMFDSRKMVFVWILFTTERRQDNFILLNLIWYVLLQQNDIAIITLDTPVPFTADVSPACIDGVTTKNYDENDAVTIGWGRLSESILSRNSKKNRSNNRNEYSQVAKSQQIFKRSHYKSNHKRNVGQIWVLKRPEAW